MQNSKIVKTLFYIAITNVLIFCLCVSSSMAIKIGEKTKIHADVAINTEYDSNIYLSPENETDDTIFHLKPNLGFDFTGSSGSFFRTGYQADLAAYSSKSDNNFQTHKPYLRFAVETPVGFYVRFNEFYKKTSDPYGSDTFYQLGTRTSRWENDTNIALGFDQRFVGFELKYKNAIERYDEDLHEWQDLTENIIYLSCWYNFTPKTAFLIEYRNINGEYDSQNDGAIVTTTNSDGNLADSGNTWSDMYSQDYTKNEFYVGLKFKPTKKLKGALRVGFGKKEFDNNFDVNGEEYNDEQTWLVDTDIKFALSDKTKMDFAFLRSIEGTPTDEAKSYVKTKIAYTLKQYFTQKLMLELGLSWINDDYRDETLKTDGSQRPNKYNNMYGIGSILRYNINKSLRTSIGYSHQSRNSSHTDYSYDEFDQDLIFLEINSKF